MQIIKGAAAIQKAITSIQGRGAKLDKDIHLAACSVLAHAAEHGDTTLADKLVQAMPKGGRKLALVAFLLNFGNIRMLDSKADKAAIDAGRLFTMDKSRKYDCKAAEAVCWTEFKKEADIATVFDAQAAVHSLLNRLKKATEGKLEIHGREAALLEAKALVKALEE